MPATLEYLARRGVRTAINLDARCGRTARAGLSREKSYESNERIGSCRERQILPRCRGARGGARSSFAAGRRHRALQRRPGLRDRISAWSRSDSDAVREAAADFDRPGKLPYRNPKGSGAPEFAHTCQARFRRDGRLKAFLSTTSNSDVRSRVFVNLAGRSTGTTDP